MKCSFVPLHATLGRAAVAALAILATSAVLAAGGGGGGAGGGGGGGGGGDAYGQSDPLRPAKDLLAAKDFDAALAELRRTNDTGNADWNNLMGYALRKQKTPDLPGAEDHYKEALRINPHHRGALEYSGELYLMKGDLPSAEKQLARLDKECFLPCEEYSDLKRAVQQYKTGGVQSRVAE